MQYLSLLDVILSPVYLGFIYFISRMVQSKRIETNPEYKYYLTGITVKLFGGLALVLVYTIYYNGGDTTNYFQDGVTINRLLFKNAKAGLDVLLHGANRSNYYYFDSETGYPVYVRDEATSFVSQIVAVLTFFGGRSLLPTTFLISWISFVGIWSMYKIFLIEFPRLDKEMAIAFFFIPSVVFWASGILKDTISLSALGFFTSSFYQVFIKRKKILSNVILLIISAKIILIVKAYIFFGVLPGVLIWMASAYLSKVEAKFVRNMIGPLFIAITVGCAYLLLDYMGDSLGKFSVDQILDRAVITQRDLKSDYYRGNTFDIGEFDSTIPSILSVSHRALFAGLYRPFITEVRNVLMLLSAIENLVLLIFTIKLLIRLRVFGFFGYFYRHNLLTFSLIFSLFFSLSVGLSTSNFGSMVRYKIPSMPFFVASLMIIRHMENEKRESKLAEEIRLQKYKQLDLS